MAAGLAHEVKNPLGAIKGAAQLLGEPPGGARLDPSEREFLGIILEEVDRLDRVVGSVLDYARPKKGNPGATEVNGVVLRTLQVMEQDRGECVFDANLAEGLPQVRVDAEQLRQVLMNLIHNAMQSMNGRGTVRLHTRVSSDGHAGPQVEIHVVDQGPGIQPEELKNLFVPFFTTKDKGSGLGLAISQRIVEEFGGRIEVRSQPGTGSTFSVILPAHGPDSGPQARASAKAGQSGSDVTVPAAIANAGPGSELGRE
jgi:signal transduction histidine kinase